MDLLGLSDLHDLLQRVVAGSQFGHGERGGDADGGHEDVVLGAPAAAQPFVQGQGEAAVGVRQLPYSGVGGLREGLGLGAQLLRFRFAVDAARLQGEVFGLGAADVQEFSGRDQR